MTNYQRITARLPRMWDWIILTVVLLGVVAYIAPQQLNVVLYKSLLVSIAAVLTYWVDRSIYLRVVDQMDGRGERDIYAAARVLSRALVFLGCTLGMTMGL